MFFESFQVTVSAVIQIFILGLIGYVLVKKNILGDDGLRSLSRLVIEITIPFLIFSQLISNFSFSKYADWWVYPLLSIIITITGLIFGGVFLNLIKGTQAKVQFLSLTAFQNSGYLPLVLVAAMLPKDKMDAMFIYIFLFLLGFNLVIWSAGVYMLTFTRAKRFEMGSLFSPPVIATLLSLIILALGLHKYVPGPVLKPVKMIGDCSLPLAMFVVGGNLAAIKLTALDKKSIILLNIVKLVSMPLLGLWVLSKFNVPELMGLLIIMQLAMPPATSLSVIIRHYKKEDVLISQGIFFGHLFSLLTIPFFLSLYFSIIMLK